MPGIYDTKDVKKILQDEFARITTDETDSKNPKPIGPVIPRETDIAIIGGGAMGSAVAFWLMHRLKGLLKVHVIERDHCYTRASTVLSCGGLRQQFSMKENVEMSLFTAEFFKNIEEYLGIPGQDPPDIQFNHQGYMFMATDRGKDILTNNLHLQQSLGAQVDLYDQNKLQQEYPWLNSNNIAAASYGLQNEGWFDPWALLCAMRKKAQDLGAVFVKGEAIGFTYKDGMYTHEQGRVSRRQILDTIEVKAEDGNIYPMKFSSVVNCAGPWAGRVAEMAGIGSKGSTGANFIPLPIEPRKRYVFVFHCPDGPGLEMPFMIDPTGVYVRREGLGGHYICGVSPAPDQEPDTSDLTVDYDFFTENVWPILAHRIPAFECLKLKSAWAGYYDYNYYDQNLIIGNHPYYNNMLMAVGSSGHGIQHSPAIGRAITELIVDNEYQTIDLSRFSFDRILDEEPLFERNIV